MKGNTPEPQSSHGRKRKTPTPSLPPPKRERVARTKRVKFIPPKKPLRILCSRRYNPISEELQREICERLNLNFIDSNQCDPGGPDVRLKPPTFFRRIAGDGNCLFRSLSYAVTGSESQHSEIRRLIVNHYTAEINCWRLVRVFMLEDDSIEEYLQRTNMAQDGVWGSTTEMLVFAHLAGVNIASYNANDGSYHMLAPGVIEPDRFPQDDSRPTIYLLFSDGNHFNVTVSQD